MVRDIRGRKLPKGIRQRGKNTFEGRVTVKGKTHVVYRRTEAECKDALEELRQMLKEDGITNHRKHQYSEWFLRWIQKKEQEVKQTTVQLYKSFYNARIKGSIIDGKYIDDITPDDIENFYVHLKQDGLSDNYINTASSILGNSLKRALRDGLIDKNPVCTAVKPRKTENIDKSIGHIALTIEQQQTFLECAKESDLYNFFTLMLHTGLRCGEAMALQEEDIDWDNSVLFVRRTLSELNGKRVMGTPKQNLLQGMCL